jgi:hypothetical protein
MGMVGGSPWSTAMRRLSFPLEPIGMGLVSSLKAALSNNGGFNSRRARFAGLLADRPTAPERIAILHSLIFPNGVRKTTAPGRNSERINRIARTYLTGRKELKVIDVGSSSGLDASETVRRLSSTYRVTRYVLADLYPGVHYDPQSGVVYDEDGHPLQLSLGPFGFFSFHFSHNFAWQVPLSLAERIVAESLKSLVPEPGATKELLLADPSLMDAAGSLLPPFELIRFNVFKSKLDSEFDLVVCLHLLVERYFGERTIDRGIGNLKELVAPGGLLVAGDLEGPRVWRKKSNGEFERLTDV